jgi:hypothetical protein
MNEVKIGTFINDILKILEESYKSFEDYRIDFQNEDFQNNKVQLNPTTIYKIIKYNTKPSESSLDIIKNFIIEKSTNQTKKGITTNNNGKKIIEYCSNFINKKNDSNFSDILNYSFNEVIKNSEIQDNFNFELEGEPIKPLNLKQNLKKKYGTENEKFENLKTQLFNGSIKLFNNYFSENGRYENLKIDEALIPKINFKVKDTESMTLKQSIEVIRFSENWHCILTGENLSGKTISFFYLWKSYLSNLDYPIPIYIDLNEYDLSKYKNQFIIEKIISDYLDTPRPVKKDINRVWQFLKQAKYKIPSIILLLDGFNEIQSNKNHLLYEINNFVEKLKGVQIIISSTYNFKYYLNWQNFNSLDITNLEMHTVINYLNENNIKLPDNKIMSLLKKPIFLSIYTNNNDIIKRNILNPLFNWKENISSYENIMWNYIELNISKKFETSLNIYKTLFYSLIIKFLFPYVCFNMQKIDTYTLKKETLFVFINEAFDLVLSKKFIEQNDIYVDILKTLTIKKNILNLKLRYNKVENIINKEMSYIYIENNICKFYYNDFRDFFASLHLKNNLI